MTSVAWRRLARLGCIGAPIVGLLAASAMVVWRQHMEQQLVELRSAQAGLQDELERLPAPAVRSVPAAARLPLAPDVAGTLATLEGLARASGCGPANGRALPSPNPGRQEFKITGACAPASLCALLAAIEADRRLMILDGGTMAAAADGKVAFEFELSTYHRAEAGR